MKRPVSAFPMDNASVSMVRSARRLLAKSLVVLAVYSRGHSAQANTGIVLETVGDYSYVIGNHTQDTDCNTEGAGFLTPMDSSGIWSATAWYQDLNVWDTDFYDPDLTGGPNDNDTTYFDQNATAISYFIGHGQCDDATNTVCTSDANCGTYGYCPNFPLPSGYSAACIAKTARSLVTSSGGSSHSNVVYYGVHNSTPANSMAFGEDSASGSFGGVGTNGGTNIAIITNSCGQRWRYRSEDQNHFYSGVHMVMMHAPVGNIYNSSATASYASDTLHWSARGSTLANLILTNVNAPASTAWLTPAFVSDNFGGPNAPAQGNLGINTVGAFDSTWTNVVNRLTGESWANAKLDLYDPTSNAIGGYMLACNFANCSSYNL